MAPAITAVEWVSFEYPLSDVTSDPTTGKLVYQPGETHHRTAVGFRLETDVGIVGEYVGGSLPGVAQLDSVTDAILGANPLARERVWTRLNGSLRMYDGVGIGPVDIALWDFAGKYHGAPIHELLGTYRKRLPAYASTYFAGGDGGFDGPADYAAFAVDCQAIGYPAFKIHPWVADNGAGVRREVDTIHAVADAVGDSMALMHDPVCAHQTFGDALVVGRACDDRGFLWYEDPYGNGGSQHGHGTLRDRLETPLLQTELVRGIEAHADFAVSGATDFLRADVDWDGGITGAMKIARIAEGLGLDTELHLPGPAQRHCMAAIRNSNFYELGLVHPESGRPHVQPPIYANGYSDTLESIADDGTVQVPDGDGLGVEYDWGYIRDNALDGRVYQ